MTNELRVSEKKMITASGVEVTVYHVDKPETPVIVRLQETIYGFVFKWSDKKISAEAKEAICKILNERYLK